MNPSNCIIVHGVPLDEEKERDVKRRTYDKHWIPWIKENLEKKRLVVKFL